MNEDMTPTDGVWFTIHHGSRVTPYPSEIEALRAANASEDHTAVFAPWGQDPVDVWISALANG